MQRRIRCSRLPSLVDLIMSKYKSSAKNSDPLHELDWKCSVKESSIRTIRLDHFGIHHSHIVKLILSCHRLDSFALSFSPQVHNPFDYSYVISALETHHPELEAFSVTRSFGQPTAHTNDVPLHHTSLRNFRKLRYLAAPLELLVSEFKLTTAIDAHPADQQAL